MKLHKMFFNVIFLIQTLAVFALGIPFLAIAIIAEGMRAVCNVLMNVAQIMTECYLRLCIKILDNKTETEEASE